MIVITNPACERVIGAICVKTKIRTISREARDSIDSLTSTIEIDRMLDQDALDVLSGALQTALKAANRPDIGVCMTIRAQPVQGRDRYLLTIEFDFKPPKERQRAA